MRRKGNPEGKNHNGPTSCPQRSLSRKEMHTVGILGIVRML